MKVLAVSVITVDGSIGQRVTAVNRSVKRGRTGTDRGAGRLQLVLEDLVSVY